MGSQLWQVGLPCIRWDLLLRLMDSWVVAFRLSSWQHSGLVAPLHGIFIPWPGIQSASPALNGKLLTTGPHGKSPPLLLLQGLSWQEKRQVILRTLHFGYCCCERKVKVLVAQWSPTLCDHMDRSLPGSPVHGILQARILEWVAIPFFRGSSRPSDRTHIYLIVGRFFTFWATNTNNYIN